MDLKKNCDILDKKTDKIWEKSAWEFLFPVWCYKLKWEEMYFFFKLHVI